VPIPDILTEQRASTAAPRIATADTITIFLIAGASTNSTLSRFLPIYRKYSLPKVYNAVARWDEGSYRIAILPKTQKERKPFLAGTLVKRLQIAAFRAFFRSLSIP
jgi:hypothetical protein